MTTGYDYSSTIGARLQIDLCLPLVDDELLARVVPWLQEHLPCRLSRKQWRTWTPSKSGILSPRNWMCPACAERQNHPAAEPNVQDCWMEGDHARRSRDPYCAIASARAERCAVVQRVSRPKAAFGG